MSETIGFPPIAGPGARVLVLGSLPSVKSVEKLEYYGHPQNAFWKVMGELFGAGLKLPYAERVDILIDNGIAVWDVLAASVRPGSLDAAIDETTARPNDFSQFLRERPDIELVCFNGKTAARLFERLVAPALENGSNVPEYQTLPSTSPAYASITFTEKLERWRVVQTAADNK
ncbi:MAG: DNA-deoxyinosine glycosylase [Woeseiaceae bacterium]